MSDGSESGGESISPKVVSFMAKAIDIARAKVPPHLRSLISGSDLVQSALYELTRVKRNGTKVENDIGLLMNLIELNLKIRLRFYSQDKRNVNRHVLESELPEEFSLAEAGGAELDSALMVEFDEAMRLALSDLDETSQLAWKLTVLEGHEKADVINLLKQTGQNFSLYRLEKVLEIVRLRIRKILELE